MQDKNTFSIPYTFKISKTLKELKNKNLHNKVNDIYFSDGVLPSARNIILNEDEKKELQLIKKDGFKLNYIFNPRHYDNEFYLQNNFKRFLNIIENLKDFYNFDTITLNNTVILKSSEFRKLLDDLNIEIKLSVNNSIDNLEKLKIFYYEFGIYNFTLDRKINRDWDKLEKVSEFALNNNIKLTLLVNEGCLPNCPYKDFCDEAISQYHKNIEISKDVSAVFEKLTCNFDFIHNFEKVLQSPFISPLWLNAYTSLYPFVYKLSGRNKPKKILEKIIMDYIFQKNDTEFKHFFSTYRPDVNFNFYDLEEYSFFEQVKNCKLNCYSCPNKYQKNNYCTDIILALLK